MRHEAVNFLRQAAAAERMAAAQMAQLAERGYRRVSNAHGMLARIDRPDWIEVLATNLRRAPADFYVPGDDKPAGNWCDYYRRTLSGDHVTVEPAGLAQLVPTSCHDDTGYIA